MAVLGGENLPDGALARFAAFGEGRSGDAQAIKPQRGRRIAVVAAGVDLLSTGTALVGAYAALESLELEEKGRAKAPLNVSQTTLGLYGGWRSGGLAANGAASVGFSKFQSDRTITTEPSGTRPFCCSHFSMSETCRW